MDKVLTISALLALNWIVSYGTSLHKNNNTGSIWIPGRYTDLEQKALLTFRNKIEHELYETWMRRDEFLIRWIRDQNFNLEKAQEKLIKALKWRQSNRIDTILNENLSAILSLCPFSNDGRDKQGRPVITMRVGSCPMRKIILNGNNNQLHRMFYFAAETSLQIVRDLQSAGQPIDSSVVIGDLSGFNWKEHACTACLPLAIEFLTIYENYYPQYIRQIFAVNVPRAFQAIITLVWPFMSQYSQNTLQVFGYNKKEWQGAILKIIDADQLIPEFGGTKVKLIPISNSDIPKQNK